MPIEKIAICDVCGKKEDLDVALHGSPVSVAGEFLICNRLHVICSIDCLGREPKKTKLGDIHA